MLWCQVLGLGHLLLTGMMGSQRHLASEELLGSLPQQLCSSHQIPSALHRWCQRERGEDGPTPSTCPPPRRIFPELQPPILPSKAFPAEPWDRGGAAAIPFCPSSSPVFFSPSCHSQAAPANLLPPETCSEKQGPGSVFLFSPDSSQHTPAVPQAHSLPHTPFP